jgi:hypothetical protein
MPTLPVGGRTSPSPSSRVGKTSKTGKQHRGAEAEFKCHYPLTSESLDDSCSGNKLEQARSERQKGSRKMGEM